MATHGTVLRAFNWRVDLPVLTGRLVTLREPMHSDRDAFMGLLSLPDASKFALSEPFGAGSALQLIERAVVDREAGAAFTYTITFAATGHVIGLIQVRQLDPLFETAAWDCTIVPEARGTGAFWEAAHLVASFSFMSVGASRLEARVDVDNGRAKAALRKMGAVLEGVLRRSGKRGHEYFDQALWAVLKDTWEFDSTPPTVVVH